MASYSYKPATGNLEGASTVVPLKAGGFLEVRRGDKTRWAPTESRQVWHSLSAWEEGLPVGATILEKTKAGGARPFVITEQAMSADFHSIMAGIGAMGISGGQ